MTKWLNERLPQEQVTQAHETLFELYQVVHNKRLIGVYTEDSQKLEKAVQIFIRMNASGTPLSHSDLLFSIAVAQWTYDARKEIHTLVDEFNRIGIGFSFSKDLVLKAGLMLSDIGSVGFKVDNFNRENMKIFEDKWEDIKRTLTLTIQLVSTFGFNRRTLSAHNAILPIAYYLSMKNPGEAYLTHSRFSQDRRAIREWLIRSLLKSGIWGSGLDTLLTALRQVIRDNGSDDFPVARIREAMERRGRSLVFEDKELENLADMGYGDRRTFALLSLLFPFVDLRNQFHVDHIFPKARFTDRKLRDAGVPDDKIADFKQRMNRLANLQLLQGAENNEKRARMPAEWLRRSQPDPASRQAYRDRHLLGEAPESITEFDTFYDKRRERLKAEIKRMLGR